MSTLRTLAIAMQLYADQNSGAMPPDLATLLVSQELPATFVVCPSSDDEPSAATQPASLAADFARGGHCSYVYLGHGKASQWMKDDVILVERLPNHSGSVNALFGDFHAESVEGALVAQLQSQATATTQPVRLPPNRSPTLRVPR